MPTAHVYDPRAVPETVCIDDSSGVLPCHVGLMFIEKRRGVGGVTKVGKERLAVNMVESRLAGPDTVEQVSTSPPPPRRPVQHGRCSERARHFGPQWLSQRRKCEPVAIGLLEYADTC